MRALLLGLPLATAGMAGCVGEEEQPVGGDDAQSFPDGGLDQPANLALEGGES